MVASWKVDFEAIGVSVGGLGGLFLVMEWFGGRMKASSGVFLGRGRGYCIRWGSVGSA